VHRGLHGNRDFSTLKFFPQRIKDLRRFAPAPCPDGLIEPKMVFVNSLSDFWHEDIPEKFIEDALDAFEQHPDVIIQILTKRAGRMRRVISDRYGNRPVPANFWFGVTCEDNRVARTLDILRGTKDRVGEFTAFASIEPITAPCDKINLHGIDWVLTGGESGPHARPMEFSWLEELHERIADLGTPLHFKQYGHPRNNPYAIRYMNRDGCSPTHALKQAIATGMELSTHEKGGATYKGRLIQEKPAHFYRLKAALNERSKPSPLEKGGSWRQRVT
jgi:protein gp37